KAWKETAQSEILTVCSIKELCKTHSFEVVFLCETKNTTSKVKKGLKEASFGHSYCVEPNGIAGKLIVGWKESVMLQ
ncbi:hypothetical protein S83_052111, partial [Arachis hypogaea]